MADGYSNDYANPNAYNPAQIPGVNFGDIQQAVARYQSPYTSFGAHGWLQDNHPGIARGLDNIFLTAANIPQGRTTGENIAGVAHGLIAGRQMGLQHQLQQATLPLEIAQRQMAYNQGILNMQKTQAETNMYGAHAKYFGAMGEYRDWMKDDKPMYGNQDKIDDNGNPWRTNLRSGQMEYVGTDELPKNYNPTFNKANTHARMGGLPGGLEGQILFGQNGITDPSSMTPDQWRRIGVDYTTMEAQKAGMKAGAVDKANQPKQTADDFLKSEKDRVASLTGKRPDPADQKVFESGETIRQIMGGNYDPAKIPSLEDRQKEFDTKAGEIKKRFGKYTSSNAWRKGKSFNPDEWADQPQDAPQQAPSQVPGAASGQRPDLNSALDSIFPRR